jgi:hypothetical protein
MMLVIFFRHFGFIAPKDFLIILFSQLSTLGVLHKRVVRTQFDISTFLFAGVNRKAKTLLEYFLMNNL